MEKVCRPPSVLPAPACADPSLCMLVKSTAKEKTAVELLNEKLAAANGEMETLRRELAHREDTVSRLRDSNTKLKQTVEDLEKVIDDRTQDRQDFAADSNVQFRKLQVEMQSKVTLLETQVSDLKATLESTTIQLNKKISDYAKLIELKDGIIEEQSTKISCMATEFESMLNETMEKVARKIQLAADQWNGEVALSPDAQRRYQEFSQ
ncbi:hypothetical protein BCR44DRAFT_76007 [Catenaria anguillulae PL171]|uniref:Dynein regulatory complex protein 12 n=1 Tax=Catenaria anguillulae PL171 TaxID=765915 RepID=A0A1Y2HQB4_9FUNG|nr:hypothetical protein BCR44DRAFT_76007 [Catenaria anguillulae PL171]